MLGNPNPKSVIRAIQGLIIEFEHSYKDVEVPQVDVRNLIRRLKLAIKMGSKVVAPYYTQKLFEIEAEMKRVKLEKEKEVIGNEITVTDKLARCRICKQVLDIDRDLVGWNKQTGWHHIGTCPKGQEREINFG